MGTFSHTGHLLHGRMVYRHETRDQHIFYIYGEFDGWLLGRSEMPCFIPPRIYLTQPSMRAKA